MSNPLISVIVPVYNVEQYLPSCLDSILGSTYTNWECLLVDDGSTDRSGIICDRYAASDARFRVFHKENGGVSSARNKALENMNGEWLMFLDSDDEMTASAMQNLLTAAMNSGSDMSMGNYVSVQSKRDDIHSNTYPTPRTMSFEDVLTLFFVYPRGRFQGYLTNRIMKASVVRDNHLRFREDIYYKEDGLFLVQYLLYSKKDVPFITDVIYLYKIREGSAMMAASRRYNRKYLTNLDARIAILNEIERHAPIDSLVKLAKESVLKVVHIIMRKRPDNIRELCFMLRYILSRLLKERLLVYSLWTILLFALKKGMK